MSSDARVWFDGGTGPIRPGRPNAIVAGRPDPAPPIVLRGEASEVVDQDANNPPGERYLRAGQQHHASSLLRADLRSLYRRARSARHAQPYTRR